MKTLDTVLLLALPASGKSEVRKYLAHLSPETSRDDFHMGPTVQLDDFPYVHMMRRVDDECAARGAPRVFFHAPDKPFRDPRDWGTLIHLLNEDHRDLLLKRVHETESAALVLLDRIDRAGAEAGIPARLGHLNDDLKKTVAGALEPEARKMLEEKHSAYQDLAGKTLVIEFARGGPHGAALPLAAPFGYQYSISRLSPAILERASILYIWVTPEESRRKNIARGDPNDPGSILHHSVPIDVMMNDYGTDDMPYLEASSGKAGTIKIEAHGRTFHLPIGRFDNRVDKTSFIRGEKSAWKPEDVKGVHDGLKRALDTIAAQQPAAAGAAK